MNSLSLFLLRELPLLIILQKRIVHFTFPQFSIFNFKHRDAITRFSKQFAYSFHSPSIKVILLEFYYHPCLFTQITSIIILPPKISISQNLLLRNIYQKKNIPLHYLKFQVYPSPPQNIHEETNPFIRQNFHCNPSSHLFQIPYQIFLFYLNNPSRKSKEEKKKKKKTRSSNHFARFDAALDPLSQKRKENDRQPMRSPILDVYRGRKKKKSNATFATVLRCRAKSLLRSSLDDQVDICRSPPIRGRDTCNGSAIRRQGE